MVAGGRSQVSERQTKLRLQHNWQRWDLPLLPASYESFITPIQVPTRYYDRPYGSGIYLVLIQRIQKLTAPNICQFHASLVYFLRVPRFGFTRILRLNHGSIVQYTSRCLQSQSPDGAKSALWTLRTSLLRSRPSFDSF